MSRRPLSLFGLHGSHEFAGQVARRLEVALALHEERDYEDGEHKTRPVQEVRGHDVFVLHALYGDASQSGNDKLCRLLFFCGALKDAGADRVTAVTPYLCYARKDRRTKPNDPVITRYLATMFEAVGVDRVIAMEVHNVAAVENAFRCPTMHIETAPLLAAHFAPLLRGQPVAVVSPDAGGVKRAEHFRQALERLTGQPAGSAYMEKFRSNGTVRGSLLAGDVADKAVVIIDDLISTGGTLVRAADACRTAGARSTFVSATHGLFIDGAQELFASAAISGVLVTNTVPPFRVRPDMLAQRLTLLDVSEVFARAIAACHQAG
jgi:ribose-phosphate pyrophosphokinase